MVELGDRVQDQISGVKGIAVCIANWLYGCRRIAVQLEGLDKDGKLPDAIHFDEPQLRVLERHAVPTEASEPEQKPKKKTTGGPRNDVVRTFNNPKR